jgi:cyclophilin family peptidyl-prolyl cis-trans isomerase
MNHRILASLAAGVTFFVASGTSLATTPVVYIETDRGDIALELYPDAAPITVDNFLSYVETGFYDDTIFHRVVADELIQGGGFNTLGEALETGDPIVSEYNNGLKNVRGTIAMARGDDLDSATSQFFINQEDNPEYDFAIWGPGIYEFGYTVFGQVLDGLSTVDAIAGVAVDEAFAPEENVTLISARLIAETSEPSYDFETGVLSLPIVLAGRNTYAATLVYQADRTFFLTDVVDLEAAFAFPDVTYDLTTGILEIQSLSLDGVNYYVAFAFLGGDRFDLIELTELEQIEQ